MRLHPKAITYLTECGSRPCCQDWPPQTRHRVRLTGGSCIWVCPTCLETAKVITGEILRQARVKAKAGYR
ncbi:MAG: hypothetical protein JRI66_11265 [Deltaproteobacteria bacterium]|nr:hypothetical protein [Deltaproteobacteria bacterium]